MKKYVHGCLLILLVLCVQHARAQKIVSAEYFFNTDPGPGNGTAITVLHDTVISPVFNIPVTGLQPGFNQLFIRLKDSAGNWSIASQRQFFISGVITNLKINAAEYFFDTDPGIGLGKAISITSADSVSKLVNISIKNTNLSAGMHQLFIRVKDNQNNWSIAEQRNFYLDSTSALPALSPLSGGEYLVTIDSGVGKGRTIGFAAADSINRAFKLTIPSGLPLGATPISIRLKDSTGSWSIAETRTMTIVCKPDLGNDTIVKVCPGAHRSITGLYNYKEFASSSWSTPNPDSVGAGTYTLIVTSSLGCKDTAVVSVINYPKPKLGRDTTVKVCPGTFTNIKGLYDTTKYTSFHWSVTKPQSVTVGTYKIYVANQFGCKDTATIFVDANPKPALGKDTAVNICLGTSKNIKPLYNLNGYTVQWSTPRPDSVTAGTFTLQVTNTYGCKDTAIVTVSNYPKPNLGNDTTVKICPGTLADLTTLYDVTGLTVHWNTLTPEAAHTGDYKLTVTNSDGCRDTALATVANNPKPMLGADSAVTVCPGTVVNVGNMYNTTGLSKTWSTARPDSVTIAGQYTLIAVNIYGCSDTAMVTIGNYAKPSLGVDTSVKICRGSSENLSTLYNTSGYAAVQWSTPTPDSVTGGTYTLVVANNNACKDTAAATVLVVSPPVIPIVTLTGSATFCSGDSALLTATNFPGSPLKLAWLKNGNVVSGATKKEYVVKTAGTYKARYTNTTGCTSFSDKVVITVAGTTPPVPVITKTGNTTFCLNDSLILTANTSTGLQWYRNNSLIKDAVNSKYVIKIGGSYKVKASGGGSCISVSDSVVAIVIQVPKPTITLANDTLFSSSSSGNQWFEGGAIITGATGVKYPPVNIDAYTVQVTAGGCKSPISDPFIYTANTLRKYGGGGGRSMNIKVYPNPAADAATLQVTGSTGRAIITITDMAGKVLWQHDKAPDGTYALPVNNFASGMYMVTVKDAKHNASVKLVKSK